MWGQIAIAVIGVLGGGALGAFSLWIFFWKYKRSAFIARLRRATSTDKAEEYKVQKKHIDMIEQDVNTLRGELYAEKKLRQEVEERMNGYRTELDTHRKHMGVLFKLCRCKNTPEIKAIREFYEKWFTHGEGDESNAATPIGPHPV